VVVLLFPFYWMVITSIKPKEHLLDLDTHNPFWTLAPTLDHIKDLLFKTDYPLWLWNTMFVAVSATILSLIASVFAAYAITRIRYKGAQMIGGAIFLAYLVPPSILFIPLSTVVFQYGLFDTPFALILTYPTILIPFSTWLLMGYFKTIPYELSDLLHSWRFYSRLALTSTDPILRAQALLRISELPSGPALIAPYSDIWLRDAYTQDSEAGVMLAACAWALPRDRRVRARLLEWVRTSQYPGQRAQALRSLEGYMDESILAFVERAEHDASAVVRERARELMYRWYRKLNPKVDDD
jgi:hypothetical protein